MSIPYWKQVIEMQDDRSKEKNYDMNDGYETTIGWMNTSSKMLYERSRKNSVMYNAKRELQESYNEQ